LDTNPTPVSGPVYQNRVPGSLGREVTLALGGTIGLTTYRPKEPGTFILPTVGASEASVLRLSRNLAGWTLLRGLDHGFVDRLVGVNGMVLDVFRSARWTIRQHRYGDLCRRLSMVHLRCPPVVQISCQLLYEIPRFEYRLSMQGRRLEAQESRLPSEAPEGPSPSSLVVQCITHPRFRKRG